MTNEEWYDTEIAPKLAELANQCGERGMSFLAAVEYAPGEIGETRRLASEAGLAMIMLAHCAKCGVNIDGYVIGLARYCREQGIPMDASMVMQKLTR